MKRILQSMSAILISGALVATASAERPIPIPFPPPDGEFFIAAPLEGAQENPPVESDAIGASFLRLNADETELHFSILVGRIEDVTQAHIHVGDVGVNGPVVSFLFGFVGQTPSINGLIIKGVITDDNVNAVGPVDGTLASLAEQMRAGATYVNVHTLANPSGEIRGQIMQFPFQPPVLAAASADVNGSGVVDFGDITAVLQQWGQPATSGDFISVLQNFGNVVE